MKVSNAIPLLTVLKTKTLEAHRAVERRIDLPVRLKDLSGYRVVLEKFLGFFEPTEARVRQVPGILEIIPDLESRTRSRLLERDLAELGLSAGAINELPRCRKLPVVATLAQALGCLYVLEGSTLGGQIVVRSVAELGETAIRASAFFLSGAEDVGRRWKRFGAAVDAYAGQNPGEVQVVSGAALQTFRCLEEWIDA